MEKENYSVWVGGVEVNDTLVSKDEALKIKQIYIDNGYDDVCLYEYEYN